MAKAKTDSKKPVLGATAATEPEVRLTLGWSPYRVDTAKRQADGGDLSAAADLWEAVMADPRAIGPLESLCGIVGLPLQFKPAADLPEGQTDPACDALESDWWRIFPTDDVLSEAIRWMVGLGVALLHRSAWERDTKTGRLLPKYDVWNPRCLKWDAATAGWTVKTAQSGGSYIAINPTDTEWIVITPYGRKRPWARAPWYGLGLLWLLSRMSLLDWGDWNDNLAKPFREVVNSKPEGFGQPSDAAVEELTAKVKSLARGGTIVLPDGYELRLVEAASKGWESFQKLLDEIWPKTVAITLTGQNLTTEVQGGSFAAASVHMLVRADRIRTVASTLASATRTGLIDWARYNFSEDTEPPWPEWQTQPESDRKAEAERFTIAAGGLSQVGPYSLLTIDEARGLLGLDPLEQGGDAVMVMAPQAAPQPPGEALSALSALLSTRAAQSVPAKAPTDEDYADELAYQADLVGAEALDPLLTGLLEIVEAADSPSEVLTRVAQQYRRAPAKELLDVTERALVLGGMRGRYAATKDV